MKNKKILVIGLGVSGIACVKGLNKLGADIIVYDNLTKDKLKEKLGELEGINANYYLGNDDFDIHDIDLAIKSPGIKYEIPLIEKLLYNNIKVISDLEAAYLIAKSSIVSITGTNGKTTTTTLVGEIIKKSNRKYRVTGNIGFGIFLDALSAQSDEILVAETSSFQLAGTYDFKPHVSVITNITPDHLDFHHTFDNYIEAKFKNVNNQDSKDYAILNYEDEIIRNNSNNLKAKKIFFSSDRVLDEGIFINKGKIYYKDNKNSKDLVFIINVSDIFIPGKHNIENAMAAAGAALALNISPDVIRNVLIEFKGVEHRLEYSGEFNGVIFYNDSKGTNPDASIKAIQGIEKPIILIAGGYDKKSEYDDFVKSFDNKVKALILLGQTADAIEVCARKYGFNNVYRVQNMDEAVKLSFELAVPGDNVVLSPACASWGMYPNYEVRGRDFKERVKYYGGSKKNK
ncbi:MAG: UDP-N-acetylmuramoyl-L-alanine--D-glutamate ligase [Tissierellia bacterium]|nr:UDP-N-acetylmuramoyl-L-alanine--D-glutamate ligase [Tissierellia bacterium]